MAEPKLYGQLELRIREFEKQLAKANKATDGAMDKM